MAEAMPSRPCLPKIFVSIAPLGPSAALGDDSRECWLGRVGETRPYTNWADEGVRPSISLTKNPRPFAKTGIRFF
jgi:hypothetical protein